MSTLASRILSSREKKGLSQQEVADAVGIKQPSYYKIERGQTKRTRYINELAKVLGVDVNWLATGEGDTDASHHNVTTIDKTNKIPVLNYVQAGVWTEVADNQYDEYVTALTKGDGLFALRIEGYSMISEFYPDDIIEVNPNVQALSGDYVVAVDKNNECTFKQYKSRGIDESTGKEWFELVALNRDFGVIDSRQHPFEIVGVAVAKTAKLRRGFN